MDSLDWQNLRSFKGSQNNAFEELCCQLAAHERPEDSEFFRKGTPDAGVECYVVLRDEAEWGWQAKFFLTVGTSQWNQIDKSVKAALEGHPKLVRYTVCLPIDRADARKEGQKSLLDRWQEHVAKWTGWGKALGRTVTFEYWGNHEILSRLSREEHRGRTQFWFGTERLSGDWYSNRVRESIRSAGPRYTPEVHVNLSIAKCFDALTRTPSFFLRIKQNLRDIRKTQSLLGLSIPSQLTQCIAETDDTADRLCLGLSNIGDELNKPINWDEIAQRARDVLGAVHICEANLWELEKQTTEEDASYLTDRDLLQSIENARSFLHRLATGAHNILDLALGTQARLSNVSALLLAGDAGQGKTHLLCDIAQRRIANGWPTILLMGQHFDGSEPWSQVMRLLGLPSDYARDDFLGALQASAQANSAKALVIIDALNEGEGRNQWRHHLPAMLATLEHYPWISVAVSVRSTYKDQIVPEELLGEQLVEVVHHGFSGIEYHAMRAFFEHYEIDLPSAPRLEPEFRNPLFLKLLCQGLSGSNRSKLSKGSPNITAIFDQFIDGVNQKLSLPNYCDFNHKRLLVQKAVDRLAKLMSEMNANWLPIATAEEALESVLSAQSYERSLYRNLVSEGVLIEDRHYLGSEGWVDSVQFAYERFTDHMIVAHLLEEHLDIANPEAAFLPKQPLHYIVDKVWQYQGLVEAFFIQIPERVGREFFDFLPNSAYSRVTDRGFANSIYWRDPSAITATTKEYLNEVATRNQDLILNSLLMVTTEPEHPYNARFLHTLLIADKMAERDAWWSVYLHSEFEEEGTVHQLVDWAWASDGVHKIDDEEALLYGLTLSWFLTSSNRFLRDRATKALVKLFSKKIPVLIDLLEQFLEVDDPYVSERLYAVAYGCVLRAVDDENIIEIAKRVYAWVFGEGEPPAHILLRDYARGIIEYAAQRGLPLGVDFASIAPPYNSEWPEIPTVSEIERMISAEEGMRLSRLYGSIMTGDFASYVIGTNASSNSKWMSTRIEEPAWVSPGEVLAAFEATLSDSLRSLWSNLRETVEQRNHLELLMHANTWLADDSELQRDENDLLSLEESIVQLREQVRQGLESEQLHQFDLVFRLMTGAESSSRPRFDLTLIQRWMVKRVLELGWTPEKFGSHDSNMPYSSRRPAKPERIGKKYQWIAFHEILARLADNFRFWDSNGDDPRDRQYEGPWQTSLRDIDPSLIMRATGLGNDRRKSSANWWFTERYETWDETSDEDSWLREDADLPDVSALIDIKSVSGTSRWLSLGGYYHWEQPVPPDEDQDRFARREIWVLTNSYLVHKQDCEVVFDWAVNQDFWDNWMPSGNELYRTFLGEIHWSHAYSHEFSVEGFSGWRGEDHFGKQLPRPILPLVDDYIRESGGYDCSIDESIRISVPSLQLMHGMELRWTGVEGKYSDLYGTIAAFDPSVDEQGPSTLLLHKKQFSSFLTERGFDVIWTVIGAKEIIGGNASKKWRGRLALNGVFRLEDDIPIGKVKSLFQAPPQG